MPLVSLIYVSRSKLGLEDASDDVELIVARSRGRNLSLGVTGALMFSGDYFAQMLEGRRSAVQELMTSIERDWRHHNIIVTRDGPIAARRFAGWQMAYQGPAHFVGTSLTALHAAPPGIDRERQAARVAQMMQEFVLP
ncbi:MAG: Photoactivated adenylate cyclase subunit beta-like protein [Bradyrhizobium sp.]|jgi:hypothetical protein|nr:Photoactivated adenylate cyclase subunit beta-like protein [Bradyrhizobium sp.]